ncbi:MAG: hypothetical protein HON51_07990 [Gammaproteobacteria bacterium]|jgi:hypothetical protein|nr:hypothetical protein [Gammaproteobacteria bacterium]MBT5824715.1 hypothetical protein [Gammaproteobacteria bacterium]MBT6421250.1 hypothetical protein [Gammaproteobacteria bacterium]MBT6576149.1 hypothetical protein [Gammaproteobacteria bacterium]MBT7436014.1 hypothetical protein [Gammaproteobacteria bacterium]
MYWILSITKKSGLLRLAIPVCLLADTGPVLLNNLSDTVCEIESKTMQLSNACIDLAKQTHSFKLQLIANPHGIS